MREKSHPMPEDRIKQEVGHRRVRYDERYVGEYHRGWDRPSRPVAEFLERYADELPEGTKALDLGAGQGRHVLAMLEKGLDAHGVELSREGLRQAQELLSERGKEAKLTQGSFYDLPYKESAFKAVVSNQSLHDIPREGAKKAFQEVARVLEDGGLFLLHVKSTQKKSSEGDGKMFCYSREDLEQLAEENGLTIERIEETRKSDENYIGEEKGMWDVTFRKASEESEQ